MREREREMRKMHFPNLPRGKKREKTRRAYFRHNSRQEAPPNDKEGRGFLARKFIIFYPTEISISERFGEGGNATSNIRRRRTGLPAKVFRRNKLTNISFH